MDNNEDQDVVAKEEADAPDTPIVNIGDFVLSLAQMVVEVVKEGGTAFQLAEMKRGTESPRKVLVVVTSGGAAEAMYEEFAQRQAAQNLETIPTTGSVQ
jgi:hypothetical protein